MTKQSVITCWILVFVLGLSNALAQTKTTSLEKQAEFKKRVVEWGINKQVNVKLNSGEKISGRLAEIQNEHFEIQSVTPTGKVTSRQINYSDLNKLSSKSNAGNVAGYVALGVLAGIGAAVLIVIAAIHANE
jgi:hypothetical protein